MSYRIDNCIICKSKVFINRIAASFAPFLLHRMFKKEILPCDLLHCSHCNIYFSEIRPDEEELQAYYSSYHSGEYATQRKEIELGFYTDEVIAGFQPAALERKKILEKYLQEYINPKEISYILDYGGGDGIVIPDNYPSAYKFVYEIQNIDTIENVHKIPDKKELSEYPWDLILCCHILEHISNPMEVITHLLSLLHNGGYFYIEVPCEPARKYLVQSHDALNKVHKYMNTHLNFFFTPPPLSLSQEQHTVSSSKIIHEHINYFNIETFEYIFSQQNITILKLVKTPLTHIGCLIKKISNN